MTPGLTLVRLASPSLSKAGYGPPDALSPDTPSKSPLRRSFVKFALISTRCKLYCGKKARKDVEDDERELMRPPAKCQLKDFFVFFDTSKLCFGHNGRLEVSIGIIQSGSCVLCALSSNLLVDSWHLVLRVLVSRPLPLFVPFFSMNLCQLAQLSVLFS